MLRDLQNQALDESFLARQLYDSVVELFPICRSITGDGVRETLSYLSRIAAMTLHEVPSGTDVFDWTIPKEWNICDAYVKNSRGERVIDFRRSNLHVMNYSAPFKGRMSLQELSSHLHTLPEQPSWIPYRTSYYKEDWGFCLSQNQLDALAEDDYEVCIDSTLEPGALSYGELCIPGEMKQEILISCHICHPSLANDNLSGMVIAAYLAQYLQSKSPRYTYRFLFVPGTIGAITWLARNESSVSNIRHGLVLAGLGDRGRLTYKRSRRGNCVVDRAASHILQQGEHEIFDFSPYGYDERQYGSPGFNLPVGRLSRTPHGSFAEYHTSADNLDFIAPHQLAKSLLACLDIFDVLEQDYCYLNTKPYTEPMLSKYGLYDAIGGKQTSPQLQMAMLWVLNYSDGDHSLLDIAERSKLAFREIAMAAQALRKQDLLEVVN